MNALLILLIQRANENVRSRQCGECKLCGGRAKICETLKPERVFCDRDVCLTRFTALSTVFDLGVKRLRDFASFDGLALPDELLCELIVLAFDARIDSMDQWSELQEMRAVSQQFDHVITECVVRRIVYLHSSLTDLLPLATLKLFTGLTDLVITRRSPKDRIRSLLDEVVSPQRLNTLDMYDRHRGVDRNLERFTNLTDLRLQTGFAKPGNLTDDVCRALTNLRVLGLGEETLVTDAGLSALRNLEKFYWTDGSQPPMMKITDVSPLSNLSVLCVGDVLNFDFRSLRDMPRVTALAMKTVPVNFDAQQLASMTQLQCLALMDERFPGVDDTIIEQLTNLRSLIMDSAINITSESISKLIVLQQLSFCRYARHGVQFSPQVVSPLIQNLVYLEVGELFGQPQLGAAVATLTNLTALNFRCAHGGSITNADIAPLTKLRSLRLPATRHDKKKNSPAEWLALRNMPNLVQLDIGSPEGAADVDDAILSTLTQLEWLNVSYNKKITDAALRNLTNLVSLYAMRNRVLTLEPLMSMPRLRYVANYGCRFLVIPELDSRTRASKKYSALSQQVIFDDRRSLTYQELVPSMAAVPLWNSLGVSEFMEQREDQ